MRSERRCIPIVPESQIYYLVDANFLVYRYLDVNKIRRIEERMRAERAQNYWGHIERQIKQRLARVFVLDICIAEAFKTLAKKYYAREGVFQNAPAYVSACNRLRRTIQLQPQDARKAIRTIKFHDIQTSRDIIIAVDRFFERVYKNKREVSVVDLLILATAKYLMDFFGFSREEIFIITMDKPLYRLAKSYAELPSVFDPDERQDAAQRVFVTLK